MDEGQHGGKGAVRLQCRWTGGEKKEEAGEGRRDETQAPWALHAAKTMDVA